MTEPLCCGERHYGAQCPDGRVMCCMCFIKFNEDELNKDDDGNRENVCIECAKYEQEMLKLKQTHELSPTNRI